MFVAALAFEGLELVAILDAITATVKLSKHLQVCQRDKIKWLMTL